VKKKRKQKERKYIEEFDWAKMRVLKRKGLI
jgi:hypothetical protein